MSNVTSQWAKSTGITGDSVDYRHSSIAVGRSGRGETRVKLDIGTDNLGAGDKWNFIRLPDDAIIEDIYLEVDDLDSNGTPALTLLVKSDDGTTETTHLAADTVGQAGGIVQANTSLPRLGGDAAITVFAEVGTAAATAQAGSATLVVQHTRL